MDLWLEKMDKMERIEKNKSQSKGSQSKLVLAMFSNQSLLQEPILLTQIKRLHQTQKMIIKRRNSLKMMFGT